MYMTEGEKKVVYRNMTDVEIILKTMMKRLHKLSRTVRKMECDQSGPLASSALKLYAWEIEIVARDLRSQYRSLIKILKEESLIKESHMTYWMGPAKYQSARNDIFSMGLTHAFDSH